MESENILSSGVESLYALKERVLELNGYIAKCDEMTQEEERLEKLLSSTQKTMQDEITSVTKKRREEVEATFDDSFDKTRTRMKRIRSKKEKQKNSKVSERIAEETAGLVEENRQLMQDARQEYKQNKVPSIFNQKMSYTLFAPNGIKDFCIWLLLLLVFLGGIPFGLYQLLPQKKYYFYILMAVMALVLVFAIYSVRRIIRLKYYDTFMKGKSLRNQIQLNHKKMKQIKSRILKDKDESQYGLDDFNQELMELEQELAEIESKKKDAVDVYENTTKSVITQEIMNRYQSQLEDFKNQYDQVHGSLKNCESKTKAISMEIAQTYEAYLGKEFVSLENLNHLIYYMETNQVSTISEALSNYQQER